MNRIDLNRIQEYAGRPCFMLMALVTRSIVTYKDPIKFQNNEGNAWEAKLDKAIQEKIISIFFFFFFSSIFAIYVLEFIKITSFRPFY